MLLRPITVVTALHFAVAVVIWFLLFGAVLGLVFKDDLSTFDHLYFYTVKGLAYVFCFPAMFIAEPKSSGFMIVAVQLLSSFVQANIVLALWRSVAGRNKAKQAGTR